VALGIAARRDLSYFVNKPVICFLVFPAALAWSRWSLISIG
jgi:hypothetical protein